MFGLYEDDEVWVKIKCFVFEESVFCIITEIIYNFQHQKKLLAFISTKSCYPFKFFMLHILTIMKTSINFEFETWVTFDFNEPLV